MSVVETGGFGRDAPSDGNDGDVIGTRVDFPTSGVAKGGGRLDSKCGISSL